MTVPRHHLKTVVSKHDWGWWCFGFWQYRETQKIYVHTWLTGSVIAQDKPWNFEDTPSRQSQQNSDWLAVIGDKSLSYCQTCALLVHKERKKDDAPQQRIIWAFTNRYSRAIIYLLLCSCSMLDRHHPVLKNYSIPYEQLIEEMEKLNVADLLLIHRKVALH